MIKRLLTAVGLTLLIAPIAFGLLYNATKRPIVYKPNWKVGQRWRVRVFTKDPQRPNRPPGGGLWHFRVTGVKQRGNNKSFTIKALPGKSGANAPALILTVNASNLATTKAEIADNTRRERIPVKADDLFLDKRIGRLPLLDFASIPSFQLPFWEINRSVVKQRETQIYRGALIIRQISELTQVALADNVYRSVKIKSKTTIAGDTVELYSLWEAGKPWWTNTRRSVNGRIVSEAVLVGE